MASVGPRLSRQDGRSPRGGVPTLFDVSSTSCDTDLSTGDESCRAGQDGGASRIVLLPHGCTTWGHADTRDASWHFRPAGRTTYTFSLYKGRELLPAPKIESDQNGEEHNERKPHRYSSSHRFPERDAHGRTAFLSYMSTASLQSVHFNPNI